MRLIVRYNNGSNEEINGVVDILFTDSALWIKKEITLYNPALIMINRNKIKNIKISQFHL